MWNDYRGRAVLITGGTRGIGLATGLEFAKRGAAVTLTHKWGSEDEDAIRRAFAAIDAPQPDIVEADVSQADSTKEVFARLATKHDRLAALVSNVAFAAIVRSIDDYEKRSLETSIGYTAWPLVAYTKEAKRTFGSYPRYIVGVSSEGTDTMHVNYDFVAAAKGVLETLCRYMNYRLRADDARVNVVRTRFVDTPALRDTFGDEFQPFVEKYSPGMFSTPEEVARAIFGVCSGMMDGLGGQVISVDRGGSVFENFSRLYTERERNALGRKEPKHDP